MKDDEVYKYNEGYQDALRFVKEQVDIIMRNDTLGRMDFVNLLQMIHLRKCARNDSYHVHSECLRSMDKKEDEF